MSAFVRVTMAGNIESPITQELSLEHDCDEEPETGGSAKGVIAVIVAIAVLYVAKDILLPLAIAALLAVVFTPLASRLEPLVGRFVSSALIVIAVVSSLVALGYFLTVQLTSVAVEMTEYADNIAAKLAKLETSTPEWLQRIESGVKDVQQQVQNASPRLPKARPPTIVQAQVVAPSASDVLKPALPILGGGRAALAEPSELIHAGCAQICGSRSEARRAIRRYVLRRIRSRTGLPDSSRPMTVKENAALKEPDPTPETGATPAA